MFLDCLPDFESLDLDCRTSQYPKAAFESDGSSDWPGASGTCPAGARHPTRPPAHGPDHVSLPLRSSCNWREDFLRKRLDVSCRLCPTFRNSPFATAKNLSNSVHRPLTLVGGRKPSCPSVHRALGLKHVTLVSGRTQSPRHCTLRSGSRRPTPWFYNRHCDKFRKQAAISEPDRDPSSHRMPRSTPSTDGTMVRYERRRLRQSESNVLFK